MFFQFKKSIVTIDAFTNNSAVYEYFKIEKSDDFIPGWWRNIPTTIERQTDHGIKYKTPTFRYCDGFINLYKKGLMIPMWSDLILETESDGSWKYQYSAPETRPIEFHDNQQMGNSFSKFIHCKLMSPWVLEEKTGVDFMFVDPVWNLIENSFEIKILPGILNFKYQSSTHVNLIMAKEKKRIELESGKPIAHLVPLSDKKMQIKHHLIGSEEFDQKVLKTGYHSSWLNKYKKNIQRSKI